MMWTLKSLSSVPSKTVRPTPSMPGRTSSSGINCPAAGSEIRRDVPSRAATARVAIRNFMTLLGKRGRTFSYTDQLVARSRRKVLSFAPRDDSLLQPGLPLHRDVYVLLVVVPVC